MASKGKSDSAWERILLKHPDIISTIKAGGFYRIAASEIKKFREPRLMTKHDTSESVPAPLKDEGITVLPLSMTEYALGNFSLYEEFPDTGSLHKKLFSLPEFETLTVENLSSESNAINALILAGILDDFLDTTGTVETFNGRMRAGNFDFKIDRSSGLPALIQVRGAQIEIDGGFENDESVVIMEAKNVIHKDFHIRQLYYPFRKYHSLVSKPIRLVFSQYTNLTYNLFEYTFKDPQDYSSLELLNHAAYTFEDTRITDSDLRGLLAETHPIYTDNQTQTEIPFIQADRFDRIISLMEQLARSENFSMSRDEVTQFLGMVQRQADYYPAAGKYLGLFRRNNGVVTLTAKAQQILKFGRRGRLLALASLILKHEIFHTLAESVLSTGELPHINHVKKKMLDLNVCNDGSTLHRRAQTVISWLKWIMELIDE